MSVEPPRNAEHGQIAEAIAVAKGAWSEIDLAEFERERREAWATWRLPDDEQIASS